MDITMIDFKKGFYMGDAGEGEEGDRRIEVFSPMPV
jgi:hypothetical protein